MVSIPSFNLHHHHGYHSPKTHIHFTDTHIIYPPSASYSPHEHHDHSINFVQHNHYTIPQRRLRFLFFDFVLYELIL